MNRTQLIIAVGLMLTACTTTPREYDPNLDGGLLWVKYSAEYRAVTRQVYATAAAALPGFIEDASWSVVEGQKNAAHLPVAVILDVDETVVSNIDFQLSYDRPFENWKLEKWTSETDATPIEGVREFVAAARATDVTVFFVSNRPCEVIEGNDDPCPQKRSTIDDIAEIGIETDERFVMLSEERGWNREKSVRREYIAENYRVVLLIGDDLGDFVPCVRKKAHAPCTTTASAEDRLQLVQENSHLWGNGWYILPNPMHGSWTSVLPR
jgi:acid phosphatase